MLSRPSGSREDAALNRVVTRVLAGTHTTTEAIVAEPSLNSHDDTERRSYFRKVKRHVAKHQQEAAQEAARVTKGIKEACFYDFVPPLSGGLDLNSRSRVGTSVTWT